MPADLDRLEKVVALLGSSHDGERLAALAAVERALKARNLSALDWGKATVVWLQGGAQAAPEPAPRKRRFGTWDAADYSGFDPTPAFDFDRDQFNIAWPRIHDLDARDQAFLRSIERTIGNGWGLSVKQSKWLGDIIAKLELLDATV